MMASPDWLPQLNAHNTWLPPLNAHDSYSVSSILSEESAEYSALVPSRVFCVKTMVSVKFKSDDVGNPTTLDGLCCAGWDYFVFEPYMLNSAAYFDMMARRSMYPFMFIPFEFDMEDMTEHIREFAVLMERKTQSCYNVLSFTVEIRKEVTVPDREFKTWIQWYEDKKRADPNFESEYRRTISQERDNTEEFQGTVVELCADQLKIVSLDDSESSCSICMEELLANGSEPILGLPCSHLFHNDCIREWLRVSNKCPLCRFELQSS